MPVHWLPYLTVYVRPSQAAACDNYVALLSYLTTMKTIALTFVFGESIHSWSGWIAGTISYLSLPETYILKLFHCNMILYQKMKFAEQKVSHSLDIIFSWYVVVSCINRFFRCCSYFRFLFSFLYLLLRTKREHAFVTRDDQQGAFQRANHDNRSVTYQLADYSLNWLFGWPNLEFFSKTISWAT